MPASTYVPWEGRDASTSVPCGKGERLVMVADTPSKRAPRFKAAAMVMNSSFVFLYSYPHWGDSLHSSNLVCQKQGRGVQEGSLSSGTPTVLIAGHLHPGEGSVQAFFAQLPFICDLYPRL